MRDKERGVGGGRARQKRGEEGSGVEGQWSRPCEKEAQYRFSTNRRRYLEEEP